MGKKEVKNRYGVQVGDIFNLASHYEDGGSHVFYQVVALRGETQVAVRPICQKVIAFDGNNYEGEVPLPNVWCSDEILVRKVMEGTRTPGAGLKKFEDGACGVSIKIYEGWLGYAYLDREEMYVYYTGFGYSYSYFLQTYHPEIAKQLDLRNGSGVFAIDRPFEGYGDDCRAAIRYPDGREQEVILKELLYWDEEKQKRGYQYD